MITVSSMNQIRIVPQTDKIRFPTNTTLLAQTGENFLEPITKPIGDAFNAVLFVPLFSALGWSITQGVSAFDQLRQALAPHVKGAGKWTVAQCQSFLKFYGESIKNSGGGGAFLNTSTVPPTGYQISPQERAIVMRAVDSAAEKVNNTSSASENQGCRQTRERRVNPFSKRGRDLSLRHYKAIKEIDTMFKRQNIVFLEGLPGTAKSTLARIFSDKRNGIFTFADFNTPIKNSSDLLSFLKKVQNPKNKKDFGSATYICMEDSKNGGSIALYFSQLAKQFPNKKFLLVGRSFPENLSGKISLTLPNASENIFFLQELQKDNPNKFSQSELEYIVKEYEKAHTIMRQNKYQFMTDIPQSFYNPKGSANSTSITDRALWEAGREGQVLSPVQRYEDDLKNYASKKWAEKFANRESKCAD
jgi:hypothetical protein